MVLFLSYTRPLLIFHLSENHPWLRFTSLLLDSTRVTMTEPDSIHVFFFLMDQLLKKNQPEKKQQKTVVSIHLVKAPPITRACSNALVSKFLTFFFYITENHEKQTVLRSFLASQTKKRAKVKDRPPAFKLHLGRSPIRAPKGSTKPKQNVATVLIYGHDPLKIPLLFRHKMVRD